MALNKSFTVDEIEKVAKEGPQYFIARAANQASQCTAIVRYMSNQDNEGYCIDLFD